MYMFIRISAYSRTLTKKRGRGKEIKIRSLRVGNTIRKTAKKLPL